MIVQTKILFNNLHIEYKEMIAATFSLFYFMSGAPTLGTERAAAHFSIGQEGQAVPFKIGLFAYV